MEFEIKTHSRAKRLKLVVFKDGRVIVTKPRFVPKIVARQFVHSRKDWIQKQQDLLVEKNGEIDENFSVHSREHYLKHKEEVRSLLLEKIEYWNMRYRFEYNAVRIKQLRSKWGSCSSKNNLNFNYKILWLPEELQDYIVVHELCHLGEMNHSAAFWALVTQTVPNHKELRLELKRY